MNRFLNKILVISIALFVISCSNSNEPNLTFKTEKDAKGFGLSLNVDLRDFDLDSENSNETRLMSYDLEGDKKHMKINLLRIKEERAENLINNNNVKESDLYKIPVHLFFMNKKIGPSSLVYEKVLMDITGEKSLYLPFHEFEEVRAKFTDDNANDWYIKGVIGGTPYTKKKNATVTGIQHTHDQLYDINDETDYYITRTSYDIVSPYTRMPLPFPMETPWTKVEFFFKEGHTKVSDEAKREEYPKAVQNIHFQPLGSIMRLKITNQSSTNYSFRTFFFIPQFKNEKKEIGYVNNVTREYTVDITDESLTDIQKGVKITDNIGGGLHYHSKSMNNKNISLTIEPGKSRYIFFWITKSQNQVNETMILPYLTTGDEGTKPNAKNRNIIFLTNHNALYNSGIAGYSVSTSKYREGYTYFINSTLIN